MDITNLYISALFLIVSLYMSASQAENYLLTMSKNDEVCQHMFCATKSGHFS